MGSAENQNPFKPYYNDRDCSLGICTKYCSQFCYIAFPPPPQYDPSSPFSPLIIATIVVLASAFLLVSYYLIVSKYCKNNPRRSSFEQEMPSTTTNNNQPQIATSSPSGLDETLIKTIAVCKYRKGEGLIEGTDCAVCLNEFEEDEPLRLLPKCSHAFHLPCIDAWLRSHSNCPLCRAGVIVLSHVQSTENNACVVQRPNDLVLVVDDEEHVLLSVVSDCDDDDDHGDANAKDPVSDHGIEAGRYEDARTGDRERVSKLKKSVSLGAFWSDHTMEIARVFHEECSSSSSKGLMSAMKRSVSTGRFAFTDNV